MLIEALPFLVLSNVGLACPYCLLYAYCCC